MREGIDGELGESSLRFAKLDVAEEEFGKRRGIFVVGDERFGEEGKFGFELLEVELGFVVELLGVEEDDERESAGVGFRGGNDAAEEVVI